MSRRTRSTMNTFYSGGFSSRAKYPGGVTNAEQLKKENSRGLQGPTDEGARTPSMSGRVAFLFRPRMFIFTKGFPVAPTRNHDHPQLGCITPTDGRVNGVSWFGHLGPHGGPETLDQGLLSAPR